MFSLTITVQSLDKLGELTNALKGTGFLSETDAPVKEQPKATTAKAETKAAPAKKTEPAAKAETKKAEASEDAYAPVKAATLALNKAKGRDAVVSALSAFDVTTASELKPEQYQDYLNMVEEAMLA